LNIIIFFKDKLITRNNKIGFIKKEKQMIFEFEKESYIVCPKNIDRIFKNETFVLINPFTYHGEGKIPEKKYHKKVFDFLFKEKKPVIVMSDIGLYESLIKTYLSNPQSPRVFYSTELYIKTSQIKSKLENLFKIINPKKVLLTDSMIEFSEKELKKDKNLERSRISHSEELFLSMRKNYNVKLSHLLTDFEKEGNEKFV